MKTRECRWPVGQDEDGHLFCGCATPEGLSYCPPHGRLSTADGRDPTPWAPKGEPVMLAARRAYRDYFCAPPQDYEPDVVALVTRGEDAYRVPIGTLLKFGRGRAARERGER